jgi:hypothetical protein
MKIRGSTGSRLSEDEDINYLGTSTFLTLMTGESAGPTPGFSASGNGPEQP